MILYNSPYSESYSTLMDEFQKVDFAQGKFEETAIKNIIRTGKMGGLLWKEYTIPSSQNRYLLMTELRIENIRAYTHNEAVLSLSDDQGKKMFMRTSTASSTCADNDPIIDRQLEIVTSHCLHRFRERTGMSSEIPTERVLWQFLQSSVNMAKIHHQLVSKGRDADKEYGCAYQCSRGLFFGSEIDQTDRNGNPFVVIRYNTFVSNEMLSHGQVKHLIPKDILIHLDNIQGLKAHK